MTNQTPTVIDFDAFRREQAIADKKPVRPVVFRIGGKDYPMADEPPANIALDIVMLKRLGVEGKNTEASLESLMAIGAEMFGREAFHEMLTTNKVGMAEVGYIIIEAFKAWQDVTVGEDAVRPNRATRRAKARST